MKSDRKYYNPPQPIRLGRTVYIRDIVAFILLAVLLGLFIWQPAAYWLTHDDQGSAIKGASHAAH